MIQVMLVGTGGSYSLSCQGHAEFNHGGPDVVCAAVSALCYTLLAALMGNKRHVHRLEKRIESGVMEFACQGDSVCYTMFYTILVGLRQVARVYPHCVSVEAWLKR